MEKEIKVPPYCCFGKLQDESVKVNPEKITAIYKMFDKKVHELTFHKNEKNWSLQEFSPEGEKTLYSYYSTLDKTICYHMNYLDDVKNPNLQHLRKELLKLGTVWFAPFPSMKNGDISTSYSPAGKLLAIRLLISASEDCKSHIETLQGLFEYHDPETRLRLKMHEFYETSCIIKRYDDFNYWHMAFVAEYIVPLAFVYDAVKLFHDKGLLKRNPLNRVFVQDTTILKESQEYDFLLTDISGAISYTVLLKGLLLSRGDFITQKSNFEKKYEVEVF
jgi:hypothetical protein